MKDQEIESEEPDAKMPQPSNGGRNATQRKLAYPTQPQARYEKSVFGSKKFLSYFLSDLAWKALIAFMVFTWQSGWVGQGIILTAIVCSAAVQVTYLITQTWIDRSVRVAEIENKAREQ